MPPIPASNFVLGERRAYSRDAGTPGWEALEEIVGGLEGGSSVAFASGMAGIAAISLLRGNLDQRPLSLGADLAVQSVTKFIGGHSDLLCGVVTVHDANLLAALRQSRELTGATPGTLEAFLAVRGARTLALRLERAQHTR